MRTLKPNLAQKQALIHLDNSIKKGEKKFLVVLPSGIGKTVYSSLAVKKEKGNILFLVHRKEILTQAMKEFKRTGHNEDDFGSVHAGKKQLNRRYTFATIQSLSRDKTLDQLKRNHFKFIILDEWHHVGAETYKKILKYFKGYKLLGMTATPFRLDGKDIMKPVNDNLIFDMDIAEGIEKNLLSSFKYYGLYDNVDYSKIKWRGFKYTEKDLNKTLLINSRDNRIIKEVKKSVKKKQTIGFCVSVKHANRCVKKFTQAGYKCDAITYQTKLEDRERIIDEFRQKKIQILFTRDIFNEGMDFPEVEALLFLRPTVSKTIFLQQLGRGLRKAPNKSHVVVLDFIGNYFNAWKVKTWVSEIVGHGGSRPKKPTYKYRVPTVNFEKEVVKIFETQEERNITRDKLIAEYFRVKKKLGRQPISSEFHYKGKISKYSEKAYSNYFGSWSKFLREIDEPTIFEYKRKGITEKKLLDNYNNIKKKLGRVPKTTELGKYNHRIYTIVFDCKLWSNFLKKMGDFNLISRKDFKENYNNIKKKLGRVPTSREYSSNSKRGLGTQGVRREFGGYLNFLMWLGETKFSPRKPTRYLTKKELINIYKELQRKLKKDYITYYSFYRNTGITQAPITRRFDTWLKFTKAVGVKK